MSFDVKDIIKQYAYNEEKSSYLGSFRVVDVLYHKRNGLVIIKAENGCVLPHSIYLDVLEYFKAMGFDKTKLYIKATDQNLPMWRSIAFSMIWAIVMRSISVIKNRKNRSL